jgi:hypothetical protein
MEIEKHVFVKTFIEYVLKEDIKDPLDSIDYFFSTKFLKLIITDLNEEDIKKDNINRLYSYFCDLYGYTKDIQKINEINKDLPFKLNYNYVCLLDEVGGNNEFFAFNINLNIAPPFKTFTPIGTINYSFADKEDFKKSYALDVEDNLKLYLSLFDIEFDDVDNEDNDEEAYQRLMSKFDFDDDFHHYHDDYDGAEESDSSQKIKSTITLYL